MKAELFKTRRQLLLRAPTFRTRYYFRLLGTNGEIVAQSEGYTQKHNATAALKKYFPMWTVDDQT